MRSRHGGFTLVEILVAVAIGLIGILVMTQAYLVGENFNRATLGEGGAQTNGLLALFQIERDVRMSGYGITNTAALGCEIYWYYDPNYSGNITPGSPLPKLTLAPVLITIDTTPPLTDPDQITVMYSTSDERMMPTSINSFNPSSSEVSMDGVYGFAENDLVLLVGSTGCTLGKITQVQPGPQKLQLNPGVSAPYNPPAWGSFPTSYAAGDTMLNLGNPIVRTYAIDTAKNKLRVTDAFLQAAGAGAAVLELVDGIMDLRAQYGKDNGVDNGTVSAPSYIPNDARVDQYSNTTPANSAEWQQVYSVRIGVLARIGVYEKPTVAGGNCDATTVAPTWSGGAFPRIDIATPTSEDRCYRYRVFETTIPLRNMIWRLS